LQSTERNNVIRDVLRMGDPRLWQQAAPVGQFATRDLELLLADMRDTMAAQNGAGLAAPQIGVPLRVVIFGVERNPRYPDAEPVPYTELVNPLITPLTDEMEDGWEGCLSVPGLRGVVPRYTSLRYEGFDPQGSPIRRDVDGFHARVVQHECDHLAGVLYPMRVRDFSRFGFTSVLFPELYGDADD
jgi:peptide deformylase